MEFKRAPKLELPEFDEEELKKRLDMARKEVDEILKKILSRR